ncbi:MAG: hypothetical protein PHC90_02480 [Syntrophorhabdaceae bacterium]|nr:hypothetical protein [Syntrophorhabdaceae bacterium]
MVKYTCRKQPESIVKSEFDTHGPYYLLAKSLPAVGKYSKTISFRWNTNEEAEAMTFMRLDKAARKPWLRICRLACPVLLAFLCLVSSAHETAAQRNSSPPEKNQPSDELSKLKKERDGIRTARLKLLQEQSTFHVQYFKPLDRLRKQLDTQQTDLYEECSGDKYGKNPQYCTRELGRFNDNVRYFNERLDDLKTRFTGQQAQFRVKNGDLDKKEKEIDLRISSLRGTPRR